MSADHSWESLAEGEDLVEPSQEKLWRQVNPRWFSNGIVADLAFRASEEENHQLSVSRESKVSAEDAFQFHTETMRRHSAGVAAVTTDEVVTIGCRTVDDEITQMNSPPTPGHAFVDLRGFTKNQRKDFREELADYATTRGLVFKASSAS